MCVFYTENYYTLLNIYKVKVVVFVSLYVLQRAVHL